MGRSGKVYFRKIGCTIYCAAVGKTQSSSGSSVCNCVKGMARMAFNMTRRNTGTNLTPETQKFMNVVRVTVKLTMLLKNL